MKTTENDKKDHMNQTGQSTMLDGRESAQQDISSNNQLLKRSPSGFSNGKSIGKKTTGQKSVPGTKKLDDRQQALEIYKKIDDTFLEKKRMNAYMFGDLDGCNP